MLLGQGLLAAVGLGRLKLGEQVLDLAVVGFEQRDGVELGGGG